MTKMDIVLYHYPKPNQVSFLEINYKTAGRGGIKLNNGELKKLKTHPITTHGG